MNKKKEKPPFGIDSTLLSYEKLEGKYTKSWVEESVIFEEKTGKQIATPQSTDHLGTSFIEKKYKWFLGCLILVFSLVGLRVFYLQIIQGENYRQAAESNSQRIIPIPAERGLVYDRNGEQLVKNIPNFFLTVVPQDLPRNPEKREQIIQRLAELTKQEEDIIREALTQYGSYTHESVVIQENLDYDTALSVLIQASDLPGIQIQRGSKRLYLNYLNTNPKKIVTSTPFSLSHVLGYIGKLNQEELDELYPDGYLPSDLIGKTGLEKNYETELRGKYGKKRIEVNALGKEQSILAEEAPLPGIHLELSVDIEMQNALENILKANLKSAGKHKASGIVMNPNNGEVLALISLPSFDNNDFSGGISPDIYQKYLDDKNNPLFNRSIGGTYPSGSTIKPAIAASALQEGIINQRSSFLSTGGLAVSSWFFPDWLAGGHGITNVRKSLALSVNTFYYYIGGGYGDFTGLGVAKITEYLKQFGLAKKLGIDLPGEQSGFLPSKDWKKQAKGERWYVGDTYNLSIGQGDLLVTPLQIAEVTSVLANHGTLYEPHLVKAYINPTVDEKKEIDPKVIRTDFISQNHIATVRLGMKDCVDYGSCRRLSLLPFSSAGKTGTAQWSNTKPNHAWFTAFAPFKNPEIVVTIMVEEGDGGAEMAAPIAYEFLKWWGYNKR